MGIRDRHFLNVLQKERVQKVFSIYSEKSSVSGVSFIIGSKYPVVRVCWTILLFVALLAMTTHLALLFVQYFAYNKQSVTSLDFSVLPFPAVTICNVNPIRMSQVNRASPLLTKLINSFDPSKLIRLEQEFSQTRERMTRLKSQAPEKDAALELPFSLPIEDDGENFSFNASHAPISPPTKDRPVSMPYPNITTPISIYDLFDDGPDFFDADTFDLDTFDLDTFDLDSFLETSWDSEVQPTVSTRVDPAGNIFQATKPPMPRLGRGVSDNDGKGEGRQPTSVSTFSKLYSVFRILFNAEAPHTRKEMGHVLNKMLINCDFAGRTCKASDFKHIYSNVYGNCYTLQYKDRSVTKDGPLSGLDLTLFMEVDEYLKGFTPSKGIQVVIHEQDTIPFPEDEGFSVSAGSHTMVGLKMHSISRLGTPYGDCSDVDDFKQNYGAVYTRQTCQKLCEAKEVIARCGCFDTSGVSLTNLLNFTMDEVKPCRSDRSRMCAEDTHQNINTIGQGTCFCNNPCNEKKYEKTISSRMWPDEDYARVFVMHVCGKGPKEAACERLKKKDDSKLRQEFLKLSIYFEDLNYEELKEVPNYKLVQLISDIGGTIGLWIGLSLLSLCEIFHLLVSLIVTVCCPNFRSHWTKQKSTKITSTEI